MLQLCDPVVYLVIDLVCMLRQQTLAILWNVLWFSLHQKLPNWWVKKQTNTQTVRPEAFRKHAEPIMSLSYCGPGRIYWRPHVRNVLCWHCTMLLISCCRMCRDQSTDGICLVHSFRTFFDRASVLCHWIQTVSDQCGTLHKVCCYRNGYGTGTCQVIFILSLPI